EKESRGKLLRPNLARVTRPRRQKDDLPSGFAPRSDAARNPCHAKARLLPTNRRRRRGFGRSVSLNPPPRSNGAANFPIGPIRAKWRALVLPAYGLNLSRKTQAAEILFRPRRYLQPVR